jgi:hypothetical protein
MIEPIVGRHGKAWKCALPAHPEGKKDWTATLEIYLLDLPNHHPAWEYYIISLITLKNIAGVADAKKDFPEATHEVLILALDPGTPEDPILPEPEKPQDFKWLMPANFVAQTPIGDDELAKKLLRAYAKMCIDGQFAVEMQGLKINGLSARDYYRKNIREVTPEVLNKLDLSQFE